MKNEECPATHLAENGDSDADESLESLFANANDALDLVQDRASDPARSAGETETTERVDADAADEPIQDADEAAPAEALKAYIERLEVEYMQRLADLFASCLHNLNTTETAFILVDEKLRNKIAYTVRELSVDKDIQEVGDYYETPYTPDNPEIAKRALELEARAIQVNASFQAHAAEIARATGSLHVPGPVKDAHRIAEKMERDYRSTSGGEEARIDLLAFLVKDTVRCRIVVNGDPTVTDQAVIDKIEESGLHIAEDALHRPLIKRGFRDRDTGELLDIESGTSYRDTKVTVTVTVELPTRDGGTTLCEIAIVTPEMATATVSEHPIYEITRSLDGDKRPAAAMLLSRLEEIQEAFYGGVSRQISRRLSASEDPALTHEDAPPAPQ